MPTTPEQAFASIYSELAPGPDTLMSGKVDAGVLEAFKDIRAAAHPERIRSIASPDFVARGLLAHALFLDWRDRREGAFLLEQARQHMMVQLRDQQTPNPDLYRLLEALTRFCAAWKRQSGEDDG